MTGWPDWTGQTAVIVGTGPSASMVDLELARNNAKVIAIKSSWKLAPWADILYGIDKGWWLANHGASKFQGLKVSPSPTVCKVYRARQVTLKPRAEILTGETGILGCGLRTGGGNSGFQAINLAVQLGSRRIVLVGFDMTLSGGTHWTGDLRGVGKPDAGRTESWRSALDGCADQFASLGVEILNASIGSALTAYKQTSLEAALRPTRRRSVRQLSEVIDGGENSGRPDQSEFVSESGSNAVAADAVADFGGRSAGSD